MKFNGERNLKQIKVLLVCGSGASSSFMATNIRKAANKRGLDVIITARSEAEIENYINDLDCLMVGPHLAYILDDVDKIIGDRDVKVTLVKAQDYATFNGENALDQILSLIKMEDNNE